MLWRVIYLAAKGVDGKGTENTLGYAASYRCSRLAS